MIPHMVEGFRFFKGNKVILILVSLVAVSSFLSKPYKTLMPVFADKMLKESAQPVIDVLCNRKTPILN